MSVAGTMTADVTAVATGTVIRAETIGGDAARRAETGTETAAATATEEVAAAAGAGETEVRLRWSFSLPCISTHELWC